jgi:[ribosomal protein S5]-alanine N-acetyltransferase
MNKPIFLFRELETSRLFLRKYRIEDADDIFVMYNDREVMKFAGPDRHIKIDDTIRFIESALSGMQQKKDVFWAIVLKSENKVIGDISLCAIDYKHSFAFFAVFLSSQYWRKGIISEASEVVFEFAFNEMNINRLESQIYVNNIPSISFVEKVKFKKEGELRENFYIDGKFQNSFVYSLLKNEYK